MNSFSEVRHEEWLPYARAACTNLHSTAVKRMRRTIYVYVYINIKNVLIYIDRRIDILKNAKSEGEQGFCFSVHIRFICRCSIKIRCFGCTIKSNQKC